MVSSVAVGGGVGFGYGGVEVVVELAEDGDEAVFVDELFLGVERGAGAEFFECVVAVGQGQLRVLGLLAFAVGVEVLGEFADARLLGFGRGGERELFEAVGVAVGRVVADAEPAADAIGKEDVDARGEHTEVEGVVEGEDEHFRFRQERGVEKLERAMASGA